MGLLGWFRKKNKPVARKVKREPERERVEFTDFQGSVRLGGERSGVGGLIKSLVLRPLEAAIEVGMNREANKEKVRQATRTLHNDGFMLAAQYGECIKKGSTIQYTYTTPDGTRIIATQQSSWFRPSQESVNILGLDGKQIQRGNLIIDVTNAEFNSSRQHTKSTTTYSLGDCRATLQLSQIEDLRKTVRGLLAQREAMKKLPSAKEPVLLEGGSKVSRANRLPSVGTQKKLPHIAKP